ncbi:MAG: tRNA (N(6)-L-threonylcarbamoyladenosine(37)-C(2))-methylthiotransferase MtaB, partial [Bacilli bacterium]|nr:tRNA (N(6)-L-threonylcarbamoyladenosine(37)-C(2))-methylthiotransferase MtaB [Bacilli bacterium]
MKFSIITLGCKVNTYESEAMKELLLAKDFKYEDEYVNSDIVIVNTCSVTNMADNKSKKIIRRIRRENDKAILVVCGCSSQNNTEEYQEMDIDILLGNKDKSKIVDLINEYLE